MANPAPVAEITYREMRELSYTGFSVFHDEALEAVFHAGIPVAIKNTNNPQAPGTRIVLERQSAKAPTCRWWALPPLGGFAASTSANI